MGYKLNYGGWNGIFALPNDVVDKYIKLAGGNNLKVLLYIVRYSQREHSATEISLAVSVAEDDVKDALVFWAQTGLITDESGNTVQTLLPQEAQTTVPTSVVKKVELYREPVYTPKEIVQTIKDGKNVDYLYEKCEELYGRPLKFNEQNALAVMLGEYGLKPEVVLMLEQYCFSIKKTTPAYVKTIAASWADNGINTIQLAEERLNAMHDEYNAEAELKKLFEMHCAFSRQQKDYISHWLTELGFTVELIDAAYQESMNKTGKMSFPYMDKILKNWKQDDIKSVEDVNKSKEAFRKKKNEDTKPSFDVNQLDKIAMQQYNSQE